MPPNIEFVCTLHEALYWPMACKLQLRFVYLVCCFSAGAQPACCCHFNTNISVQQLRRRKIHLILGPLCSFSKKKSMTKCDFKDKRLITVIVTTLSDTQSHVMKLKTSITYYVPLISFVFFYASAMWEFLLLQPHSTSFRESLEKLMTYSCKILLFTFPHERSSLSSPRPESYPPTLIREHPLSESIH